MVERRGDDRMLHGPSAHFLGLHDWTSTGTHLRLYPSRQPQPDYECEKEINFHDRSYRVERNLTSQLFFAVCHGFLPLTVLTGLQLIITKRRGRCFDFVKMVLGYDS